MLSFSEMLKGKQHKLDKNKNGKVDSHDFKLLRKEEQELEEASKSGEGKVETKKYSWGTMKTVHHGSEFSVPLHPEHHQAIAKLKDNQEHKFKDETGRHWTAKRMGDKVHIHGANDGGKTVVNHSDLKEEVEELDEATPNKQQVKQAIGIARDKRYAGGNMTGAVKAMDKVNKGLAQHPAVKKELQKQNEEIEQIEERNKQNAMMRKTMDASRGARYKLNNPVPDADPKHKTARDHNVAIGRALRKEEEELDEVAKATGDLKDACWKGYTAVGMKMKNGKKVPNCVPVKEEEELEELNKSTLASYAKKATHDARIKQSIGKDFEADRSRKPGMKAAAKELADKYKSKSRSREAGVGKAIDRLAKEEVELDEKMNMSKADMGDVIKDFKKSDAPQFAGKSVEKRRQMAIAAKLQADRVKKEGVEMKSYKQFMEELVGKLPEDQVEVTEEAVDEGLDMKLLKSMQKDAKPRPKTSSDAIDPKTGKLKPYGYRGKSEYEKSETGDDEEPQKRGRKSGVSVGTYKRRQPK
jgi:hypothetical protein